MVSPFYSRRSFLVGAGLAGAALSQAPLGALSPAAASGLAPTETMRGGSNNYRPNAPLVERLGTGFFVSGMVLRAGDGAPLEGVETAADVGVEECVFELALDTGGASDERGYARALGEEFYEKQRELMSRLVRGRRPS